MRVWWLCAFVVALFGPVVLRIFSPERQGFAQETVTITGLLAFSLLACTVILPSRVKTITRELGIESVLSGHSFLGACTALVSILHVVAVVAPDPEAIGLLDPFTGPYRALAGLVGVLAISYVVVAAPFRERLNYETWRWLHVVLAVSSLIAIGTHIWLIGHLVKDPLAGGLLAAIALTVIGVLFNRWYAQPFDRRSEFYVRDVHEEGPGVTTITLKPRNARHADFKFRAGQFAWLRLERAPLAEEHPFTISSAEQNGTSPQFTIRHKGDWTTGPIARLRVGDRVWLSGPHGRMSPEPDSWGFVMISAGVGITPMMSILRTLAGAGDDRPILLFLADRPGEALFAREIKELQSVLNLDVVRVAGKRITGQELARHVPHGVLLRSRLEYLVCGNPRLVRDSRLALEDLHIPEERIKSELFDA